MKGLSELIGVLIVFIIAIVVLIPVILYSTSLYYSSYTSPINAQEQVNGKFVNITYIEKQQDGYLYVKVPAGVSFPSILHFYNYSKGQWVQISTISTSSPYNLGNSPRIEVEIEYYGQIYYVYAEYNTSALVG
ncbi:hypothetical protein [Sulfuracidifex metallicus]|uniref:Uncharacterized protein n=1 Tax=Sulfuracidifex metallicus DSM 6482 = JCM 9184 TaxID=523847 RepID=A0A6A9QJS1_SULME|nr:hypothetical protein [Sulfuracidifex metallicus]MUN29527.1 hypothetical protein [Sulfuracidifex metallicus DSM 6482 = JCM 9184]WOE49962.1 hypothetical protein RQ359_001455 [Sulfuracidifex metallicus DSM 6482 = JCM 9184]